MWGSRKKNNGDGDEQSPAGREDPRSASAGEATPRSSVEPTERTRLLGTRFPPPPGRDGYLDPDDPAVSPYNLWTVRLVRYFTVMFTMITFIWWVLLLVAIFVTPPGMNTRGSGFTDFSYTCLTMGNLLVTLLFFTGPSRAVRITISIVAVVLLADVIIIAAVPKIRMEESWPGVASAVWAFLISVWCIFSDRVVAWGKKEEEERLTGRPETRRTLSEWLGVFISTAITVVFILITFFMTATLILRAIDAGLPPLGERYNVDNGKYAVHVRCVGQVRTHAGKREPTVLLESNGRPSEGSGLEYWMYSAYENGTIGRYCYWDRPGYGWSDNAPSPHSASNSVDALTEALAQRGEVGPWISVSAGYGSVVARIFAARYFQDVTGMMLIDPLHEDLLHRIGGPGRGFVTWGYGILSPLGIQRLAGALFNGRTSADRVFGDSIAQTGRFLKAKLQENLVADSLTKSALGPTRHAQNRDTPLVLVSSGIRSRTDSEWESKQKDLSSLTDNVLAWDTVQGAPHEVWQTTKGREVLTKRLAQLVKAAT